MPAATKTGAARSSTKRTTHAKAAPARTRKKTTPEPSAQDRFFHRIGGATLRQHAVEAGSHRAPWTEEEDKLVVSPKHSLAEIAVTLGRSYHAVASRRAALRNGSDQ
jgi:hypothetical protein